MIRSVYQIGGDQQEVVIKGNELLFYDVSSGIMTTLEGLKLNKAGVLKEFPDLEDNENWKKIAMERLKSKFKEFKTESEKLEYIKNELSKFGYKPLYYQRAGFRPKSFKWQ